LPGYGSFLWRQEAARFTRTLGTLLKAGIPLVKALKSSTSVTLNLALNLSLRNVLKDVSEGQGLAAALEKANALPELAIRMITVGEETGRLDKMLLRVASLFEVQCQRQIDRSMTLLTPLLTLGISVLVGGLIMSVMNAILSINTLATQ
jgi:general secretion pathway protein F